MTVEEYRDHLFALDRSGGMPRAKRRRAGTAAVPISIDDLLVPVSTSGMKLKPEQALSVELYHALVAEHRAGRLAAVCTCVQNELPIPAYNEQLRWTAVSINKKRRAMGVVPGASDWWFVWPGGGLVAELKDPGGQIVLRKVQRVGYEKLHPTKRAKGQLQPEQVAFQGWCDRLGVAKTTWYSVEQALEELRERGALLVHATAMPIVAATDETKE